jgi:Fis family transcriptional regulator, factor for inversion stimulation protein
MNNNKKTGTAQEAVAESPCPPPLRESAQTAIRHFLGQLDGHTTGLFDVVVAQVEEPLLREIMAFTQNNQSKAAAMLGLNRGTLRKKLRQYSLLDPDTDANRRT